MGWKVYKLVYQAKSPIHIGWHTLGYIKLTRYYITGKNIWAAMTANITRALYDYKDYGGIGDLLKEGILTSYFFPAVDTEHPLLPRFTDKGLMNGGKPEAEFERIFIKSYGQTAVLPHSNTAEDETLHESEYISPCVEIGGKQCQVYFVGYIFISDTAHYNDKKVDLEEIKQAISEIFVGGDRKYGWGRLLLDDGKKSEVTDSMVFGNTLYPDDNGLKIRIEKDSSIPAHLKVDSSVNLKGDIEPLVGREWGEVTGKDGQTRKGFGQRISEAKIYWMPGSIIEEGKPLKIGAYGILE